VSQRPHLLAQYLVAGDQPQRGVKMDKNRVVTGTSFNSLLWLAFASFLLWLTHSFAVREFLRELSRLAVKFVLPGSR